MSCRNECLVGVSAHMPKKSRRSKRRSRSTRRRRHPSKKSDAEQLFAALTVRWAGSDSLPVVEGIIGAGYSGCVVEKPLPCEDPSFSIKSDWMGKLYTEVDEDKLQHELAMGEKVSDIDATQRNFLPLVSSCKIAGSKRMACKSGGKAIIGTQAFTKSGGKPIGTLLDETSDRDLVLNILRGLANVLEGIKILVDNKIVHDDVRGANIVYDDKTKTCRLIDFGESHTFDEIIGNDGWLFDTASNYDNMPSYAPEWDVFLMGYKDKDYYDTKKAEARRTLGVPTDFPAGVNIELFLRQVNYKYEGFEAYRSQFETMKRKYVTDADEDTKDSLSTKILEHHDAWLWLVMVVGILQNNRDLLNNDAAIDDFIDATVKVNMDDRTFGLLQRNFNALVTSLGLSALYKY
jgi:hypothetical protein